MQVNQILSEIDNEIARLQQARNILAGGTASGTRGRPRGSSAAAKPAKKKKGGRRRMSAEARKRLSEALKARWAERKKRASTKNSK